MNCDDIVKASDGRTLEELEIEKIDQYIKDKECMMCHKKGIAITGKLTAIINGQEVDCPICQDCLGKIANITAENKLTIAGIIP